LGSKAVAIGDGALLFQNFTTATDSYNVAVGMQAGKSVTTGKENTFIGGLAGDALQDADHNVAIGFQSLSTDTLGSRSVAIGYNALVTQNFTTATNSLNTAIGFAAGEGVTTGTQNTIVGANAGDAVNTGTANSMLGMEAGSNLTTGGNNLFLGHDAGITGSPGGNFTTESGNIILGDENINNAYMQVSFNVVSDERDKTDFVDLDLGLDFVKSLEPVTYYWDKRSKYGDKYADDYDLNAQTPDGTHKEDWMDVGFKAQSVQALEEAAGYKIKDKKNLISSVTGDGTQYTLKYEKFIPILVKAIQDQDAIIQSLTARIAALES